MRIVDLDPTDESSIQRVAVLLVEGFATNWPGAWPDIESGLEEVREPFAADRISRIAVGEDGLVLVLCQGSCDVVADLEERVKERGGLTITLGTDDVNYQTSLAGIDLFPNVWEYVVNIRNLKQHPFEFYQKQGYVIVGVMPDANGPGKPDILMAKSVVS